MNQSALFNTHTMTRTKEMRALIRARLAAARALSLKRSETTAEKKSPAAPAVAPVASPMRSRAPLQEMEFNLPDESRTFPLSSQKLCACPVCGIPAELVRLRAGAFIVQCMSCDCSHKTPEMKHSDQAIRHWQLAAKLSKL